MVFINSTNAKQALIAEDDDMGRIILARFLDKLGYKVHAVENGKLALDHYHRLCGKIDLLITDLFMPEMNGHELIREIRKINKTLPIIAITGYARPNMLREVQIRNATLFEKPINFQTLRTHLTRLHDQING
ncbi:response regulator [Mariprofundus erugo]|uniref:Response regulator n=1 Tax=Mariprofundus erugo TaxID=2528639 RepID=A0A5R9GQM3_9PROT|nr:response regulator [Mariprofundus erugo]TLS65474.1 response regulator [Mariprofundus erugo]